MSELLTMAEYARSRELSIEKIKRLCARDLLPLRKRGKRWLILADKADEVLGTLQEPPENFFGKNIEKAAEHVDSPGDNVDSNHVTVNDAGENEEKNTWAEANKRKAHFQAQLAEQKFLQQTGKLVDAEKARVEWFRLARTARDSLLAIPNRLSAELAAMTDEHEIFKKLREEISIALRELGENASK